MYREILLLAPVRTYLSGTDTCLVMLDWTQVFMIPIWSCLTGQQFSCYDSEGITGQFTYRCLTFGSRYDISASVILQSYIP